MRDLQSAARLWRSYSVWLAVLAGLAMMAAGAAKAANLLEDNQALLQAVEAIKQKIGGGKLRVFRIEISPNYLTIEVQDPKNPRHIDEWRSGLAEFRWFQWQSVSGPKPVQPNLINKDLEANLFEFDEIRFDAAPQLIKEAIREAGLEDTAHVGGMEIERQVHILPEPSSGPVRWRVNVHSGRESAQIIADNRGAIVGRNLSGTNRMRNFDVLLRPEVLADAARDFRTAMGADPVLLKVSADRTGVVFDTNLPSNPAASNRRSSIHQDKAFGWNLNGLHNTLGPSMHVDMGDGAPSELPFTVDDVDWSQVTQIVAAARDSLDMPQARISEIELRKSGEGVGTPVLQWKIELTDRNGEKGSILADAAGSVKHVRLPESRRKRVDNWLAPEAVVDALAQIGQEFGSDTKLIEITFYDDKVRISADDPRQPGKPMDVYLDDKGFRRWGSGSFTMAAAAIWGKPQTFTIAELAPLTAEHVADLEARTVARMNLAKVEVTNISIGRDNMDPSPRDNITVEIRALVPPFNAPIPPGGRVVYELDGTVIKYYLP